MFLSGCLEATEVHGDQQNVWLKRKEACCFNLLCLSNRVLAQTGQESYKGMGERGAAPTAEVCIDLGAVCLITLLDKHTHGSVIRWRRVGLLGCT